jgi:hypothetical protein
MSYGVRQQTGRRIVRLALPGSLAGVSSGRIHRRPQEIRGNKAHFPNSGPGPSAPTRRRVRDSARRLLKKDPSWQTIDAGGTKSVGRRAIASNGGLSKAIERYALISCEAVRYRVRMLAAPYRPYTTRVQDLPVGADVLGLPHFRLLCGISAIHNDVLARGERRTG